MSKIIFVKKEMGYTSFDVCNKLKRVFHTKRIGHTGTLDPNATGVLIVMVDESCKILPYIHHVYKTYRASIRLGIKTDTGDIWGNVIEEKEASSYCEKQVEEVLTQFLGHSKQIPPMTSAIKVNGQKLYELQRKGITIEREPRDIEVKSIKLLSINDEIHFEAMVSTGCYIRSLVEDIAEKLGTIGTMSALERTSVDHVGIEDCYSLKEIEEGNYRAFSKEEILKPYYSFVEYEPIADIKNGKRIHIDSKEEIVMITYHNEVIAAYEKEKGNQYRSKRGLW
ncbi:MAG: tRNA pseudouridine(55) synthase TruB [Erysipelotrichaceae bacterium]